MSTVGSGGLEGATALVTGGGSGIGLACAQRLAADGARVTLCGRTLEKLETAAKAIDGCRVIAADISDEASIAAAVSFAAEPSGSLDVVVANAGGAHAVGPLVLTPTEGFELDLAVNITGTYLTIKHAAPFLAAAGGGSVVAVSSIAGVLTHPNMAPYSVSKAGLEMLVRNAADELGRFGIRVNAIRPGLVPTDASTPLASDDATRADYLEQMPLGRLGTVEDVASLVRFLAGPEATWITGQLIGVDGGHSLRRGPDLEPLVGRHFEDALQAYLPRASAG